MKKELNRKNEKEFPLNKNKSDNNNVTSCRKIQFDTVEGAYKILICNENNEEKGK